VETAAVDIGDDVWLARGVIVLPGSHIGEGSVIAAGTVVRGTIPAWVVAAGSPARVIREIRTRGRRR
jgi:acetyltransferase-like isoleucine patch superfamily enzyme